MRDDASEDAFTVDYDRPLPTWARTLMNAARARDAAAGRVGTLSEQDFRDLWVNAQGKCMLSGLPFGSLKLGNGRAKRPFYPSLDRIDSDLPYTKKNVRIVVAIANFAMNAWGDQPLKHLAAAIVAKHGSPPPPETGPISNDLADDEALDTESPDPTLREVRFPPRADVKAAIKALLATGPSTSADVAQRLADRFGLTDEAQRVRLGSGVTAWRNHVAWALVELGPNTRGSGEIEPTETGYRLATPRLG